jgi:hypothetical protein
MNFSSLQKYVYSTFIARSSCPAIIVAVVIGCRFLHKNTFAFFKVPGHVAGNLFAAVIGLVFQRYQSDARGYLFWSFKVISHD